MTHAQSEPIDTRRTLQEAISYYAHEEDWGSVVIHTRILAEILDTYGIDGSETYPEEGQ
jgi:hypothetical protein